MAMRVKKASLDSHLAYIEYIDSLGLPWLRLGSMYISLSDAPAIK